MQNKTLCHSDPTAMKILFVCRILSLDYLQEKLDGENLNSTVKALGMTQENNGSIGQMENLTLI
jgi:hypothetical protein